MDEITIRERIMEALREPPAPEPLIRRTAVRAEALEKGREAEKKLQALGTAAPNDEIRELAAQGTVGYLMRKYVPPDGVNAEALTKQLLALPSFRRLTEKPADRILADLRSGILTGRLAEDAAARQKTAQPAGQIKKPAASGKSMIP